MKRTLKTVISLILCVAMLFSASAIGFSAADEKIYCDGNCEYYPTVIIPGLGQSGVFVVDDNGDFVLDDAGKRISAFPAYIELPKIISRVAFPVILSLLTQSDLGLSDALSDAIFMAFGINTSDLKAQNTGNVAPADAFGKAETKLLDILVEIGAMEAPEVKKDMPIFEAINLWLFGSFGTDGFSEIFLSIFKTMFEAISSIL